MAIKRTFQQTTIFMLFKKKIIVFNLIAKVFYLLGLFLQKIAASCWYYIMKSNVTVDRLVV